MLWSEIDVAVADHAVTSISATTVPLRSARLDGERTVSRARAQAIAERALRGREHTQVVQAVAYAGTPAKAWRTARRAWVVQLERQRREPPRRSAWWSTPGAAR